MPARGEEGKGVEKHCSDQSLGLRSPGVFSIFRFLGPTPDLLNQYFQWEDQESIYLANPLD